ncbi:MAG: M23 family metallopeptidase [Lachnospiraceae bacterium]|nr:M23 family metallopeptidase [Lachnospiraceae bacterium]
MKRNRKNSIKKERTIMIASSVFVLAALTMTGIYMKNSSLEAEDDGYTLDFTALEESEEPLGELAQNIPSTDDKVQNNISDTTLNNTIPNNSTVEQEVLEDDLDYMPLEVGSGDIEIPGLTSEMDELAWESPVLEDTDLADAALENVGLDEASLEEVKLASEAQQGEKEAVTSTKVAVEKELTFSEADGLLRPVAGDILMNYSMESSVYFATLDQYKYNPATIFAAEEGTTVNACAAGKVVNVFEDEEIGNAITLDLGNGYQATYGQLGDIKVSNGSYVEEGDVLGSIAAPTKYYSVEGSNLYFQLTKDGAFVNPEEMLR